jgi:hypothetical protein
MTTGSNCENEGDFDKSSSRNLLKCKGKKIDPSGVCKSLIRGGKSKWVGGYSIGMCNCPVCKDKDNTGKFVF